MKLWKELTEAEVGALEGNRLDEYVARALAKPCYVDHGSVWLPTEHPAKNLRWHPHDDANQALEVWAEMDRVEPVMYVICGDAVIEVDGVELANADFCTAIARAYLKVRLADDADE